MQVLQPVGGWQKVLGLFEAEYVPIMDANPNTLVVLLIDFDDREQRRDRAKAVIPERLAERVFVLGVWTEPEDLTSDLGNFESIGSKVAEDCRSGTAAALGHRLLRHNAAELARSRQQVFSNPVPSLLSHILTHI